MGNSAIGGRSVFTPPCHLTGCARILKSILYPIPLKSALKFFAYAVAVSLPPTLTAFFVLDHGKNSFQDLSLSHIIVGALFATCAFSTNIISAFLFPEKILVKLIKLRRGEFSSGEKIALFLAALPAAFAAFLGFNLIHAGLSGAPSALTYLIVVQVILSIFFSRWFGTAEFCMSAYNTLYGALRGLCRHDVAALQKFRSDFKAHGTEDDIVKLDTRVDLLQTAQNFYARLVTENVTRFNRDGLRCRIIVPMLQALCVFYTCGLLATFIHMVHKGLPLVLDGIIWSAFGAVPHMLFYLRMAWLFVPTYMRYVDTATRHGLSRTRIFMIVSALLICNAISGTGVMNMAIHQKFDAVVNQSVLKEGQPYESYWNFFIRPILGVLACIGAGVFCNFTVFLMWLMSQEKETGVEATLTLTDGLIINNNNSLYSQNDCQQLQGAQNEWHRTHQGLFSACRNVISERYTAETRSLLN